MKMQMILTMLQFGYTPPVVLTGTVLMILLVMLGILIVNLLTFRRLAPVRVEDEALPFLSVLVPARNEEPCIAACVRSLVAQQYEPLEVLVLDDDSTDNTTAIVQQIIDALPPEQRGRLRLLHGEPLPPGWVGKNFACHQLAQHARGAYLLFTDADTVHAPAMARSVIRAMREYGVDLLTAQPEFQLGSLGERLIIPLLNFTILTLLPIALIPRRPEPALATGNGQLLCFRAAIYHAIGGHAAVKARMLEDVLLARAVKAAGYRLLFMDAFDLVRCRMYRSFAEVWTGFSKNLYAFYNYSPVFALLALLLNFVLFVLPALISLSALFVPQPALAIFFAFCAYLVSVSMRVLLTLRFTRTQRGLMLALCLLHPFSILLECLILLNSMRWHYSKRGMLWKGRYYVERDSGQQTHSHREIVAMRQIDQPEHEQAGREENARNQQRQS